MESNCPRLMIAGLSGDSGKTFVATGLARLLSKKIGNIAAFKKGPDYIDAAWLKASVNDECYNLDSFLMAETTIKQSFIQNSQLKNAAIIEANRGLYDGFDADGSHSSANIAKILDCPVILIINVTKVTRSAAAIALGCKLFDKNLNIAGVIINNVAGKRHEKVTRESIEKYAGLKVICAIPKLKNVILPSRHLGLVTPAEHKMAEKALDFASDTIEKYIDIDELLRIAKSSSTLYSDNISFNEKPKTVKIGYFKDRAFTFYYPENLKALQNNGAELVEISSISDKKLPDIHGLYIGGGFPETNASFISQNKELMKSVRKASQDNLPIYAECGGLIYLGRSLKYGEETYEFANIFPVDFILNEKPRGHGYMKTILDGANPFFNIGENLIGHEFHYSSILKHGEINLTMEVLKGTGSVDKRDGLLKNNTFGSYLHIHALSKSSWAENFVNQAIKYKSYL